MRLETRRRAVIWTNTTLVILAALGYAKRTRPPALPDADSNTTSRECTGCRAEAGALILAGAQTLERLDPTSGTSVLIKDYQRSFFVDHPNFIARDSLLVQVCHIVDGCTLRLLNPVTGTDTAIVRDVEYPAVDTVTRSVYFYAESTHLGTTLFVAPLDDLARRTRIAHVAQDNSGNPPRPIDLQLAPVVLPAGRGIVFLGSGDTLTRYDVRAAKLQRLPITDCTPVLMRTVSAELLCVDWRIGSWYLLGLENGRRTILPEATGAHSAIYDEHADALYLGMTGGFIPERADVYRLPLGVRVRRKRVAKGVYFASGIWVPDSSLGSPRR